jgi:glycerophosphoryl diester phosphodiesterase
VRRLSGARDPATFAGVNNPWLERRVLSYAHQGGAKEAPSSTLLALRQAVAAGADALELDVHASSDRHLVVCHDATVDRTTNGHGAIAELTLEELQALDNGFWWVPGEVVATGRPDAEYVYRGRAPLDPSLRIATLREVLEEFPRTFLNLDIKQTAPTVKPYEVELARLLREFERSDDVIVASFLDGATEAFSAAAPEIHTSYGTLATAAFWQAVQDGSDPPTTKHVALQVPPSVEAITLVNDRFVDVAHRHGVAVHVWTIDDADEMARLIDLGVDGIMTDRPTVLATVLEDPAPANPGS